MAVGLNKSELAEAARPALVRELHLSPPLPTSEAKVVLSYPGKLPKVDVLKPVSTTYKKMYGASISDAENIGANGFIWADNWFGLHSLIEAKTKAQLVYLDPPYATGYDFQSRDLEHAYNDSLGDAAYIEFMRRRLILLRELLDETGSIYVHIGHQMVSELKMVMDEIFGQRNFRNLISRKKCSSKNFTKNQYSNMNDYVLFYTKSANYIWNQPSQKPDPAWIAKEYTKVDEKGQYKLVPVHAPGVRRGETGQAWRGMMPPPGKHWQYQPSKLDEFDAKGEIHWSKTGNPRRKVYLTEDKSIGLSDYWDQYRDAYHQSILITGYPTEKNFDMLKMIVGASSNPGDLVIDPFCGSGSTLHAADELGRKWLGIDQSYLAAKTVTERLLRGRKPMGDYIKRESPLDLFSQEEAVVQHEKTEADFSVYVDDEIASAHPTELSELSALLR
ncbi:site-specific DNA-methyltransferase [Undibacterium aquatile]|uniref:site-specific DNA-methyltransferase (adenine-specific) n=2 Tax=Undibacterium aquatile TaxID=1537398 RepID=A0ABR6XB36_9BURK|nr:site-specific DNA-methyltransferase [Undibacterium aquatile]